MRLRYYVLVSSWVCCNGACFAPLLVSRGLFDGSLPNRHRMMFMLWTSPYRVAHISSRNRNRPRRHTAGAESASNLEPPSLSIFLSLCLYILSLPLSLSFFKPCRLVTLALLPERRQE